LPFLDVVVAFLATGAFLAAAALALGAVSATAEWLIATRGAAIIKVAIRVFIGISSCRLVMSSTD
jgi:hypothetical protein